MSSWASNEYYIFATQWKMYGIFVMVHILTNIAYTVFWPSHSGEFVVGLFDDSFLLVDVVHDD